MTSDELSKKYSNYFGCRYQINVDNEDIFQKYGVSIAAITVEDAVNVSPSFTFIVDDDPQLNIISSQVFEIGKTVQIRMGYLDALESLLTGKITAIKAIFSSDNLPQLSISGEGKDTDVKVSKTTNNPGVILEYGRNLLSATIEVSPKSSTDKIPSRETTLKKPSAKSNLTRCNAQCVGIPEIKSRTKVNLVGLGSKYSKEYVIEKATHHFNSILGYSVTFYASAET